MISSQCSTRVSPSRKSTPTRSNRHGLLQALRRLRYREAALTSRFFLAGPTASPGSPRVARERVLTSTKTRLFPSSQTMSIAPPAHRKLRSTTRKPFSTRKAAASSSPSFPIIRCRAGTASSAAVRGARPGTSCGGRDSGRACPAPRDAPGSRSPCERPTRIPDNARP